MSWIFVAAALAGPANLRAVAEQPASLKELDGPRLAHAWWDGGPGLLEVDAGKGWTSLGLQSSGAELGRVEAGARVRVTVDSALHEAVQVQVGLDPSGVARLAAPGALPGHEVADIWPTEDGAWAALLDGGLVRLDKNSLVAEPFGVAEGLPSFQVNAVRGDVDRVWVGTGQGLARLEQDRVVQVLAEELPDPWVQALAVEGESVWVGTYRGLARLRSEAVEQVLGALSVFSLEPGPDQRLWVGYEGLRGLPDAEPIEGVDSELNVWDVDWLGRRVYLATDSQGLLLLREGVLTDFWGGGGAVYALERLGAALFAAADDRGLVRLSEQSGEVLQRWGLAEGLPSDVVYEVEQGPAGKLWVGTDAGVALMWPQQEVVVPWPTSPVAAGRPVTAALELGSALVLGTEQGLVALGELPRRQRDLLAVKGPVVELLQDGKVTWVLTRDDAWRMERGRLERFPLPVKPLSAAVGGGSLWVGSAWGLHRFDGGLRRFVPGPELGRVERLEGQGALVWGTAGGRVFAVDSAGTQRDFLEVRLPTALAPAPGGIWVGTARGPQLLDPYSAEVRDLEGLDAAVVDLAVDPEGQAVALFEDGRLLQIPTGVPVVGGPPIWSVGERPSLHFDASGRLWVMGERGASVLPRR